MQTTNRPATIDELPGPRGLPILGNLLQIDAGKLHLILQRWADEFGSIYAFWILGRPVVVIADAELIQRVLRDRPDGYRRRP